MLNQLLVLAEKPSLWQRSSEPFWDDEYISERMLEAHLDPDWEAASRRHSDIDRSVKWLASMIPAGSGILDLGCGPGLYAQRLSHLGYDVTGLDISKRSIAYAKEQDRQSHYICLNYLEMDYTGAFDAVIMVYCDYGALTLSERQLLLAKVYQALKPGGLFIFDVFTERTLIDKQDISTWSALPDGGFWNAEPHICLEAAYYYENQSVEVRQTVVMTNDEPRQYLIWNTVFRRETLADEVRPAGFQTIGFYDDIGGRPYTGDADTLCAALKKGDRV